MREFSRFLRSGHIVVNFVVGEGRLDHRRVLFPHPLYEGVRFLVFVIPMFMRGDVDRENAGELNILKARCIVLQVFAVECVKESSLSLPKWPCCGELRKAGQFPVLMRERPRCNPPR